MRLVVQKVTSASVSVDGSVISSIGPGLCVLVGISRDDTPADSEYLCRKLLALRLFDSLEGQRWGSCVVDRQLQLLCVSQFTLYGQLKGNKPDFRPAMTSDLAKPFYHDFLHRLKTAYQPDMIKDGVFSAMMEVSIVNDGPVTLTLESPESVRKKNKKSEELSEPN